MIVAVVTLDKGRKVARVTATQRVPRGHKMAAMPIAAGEPIVKFGQIIGFAKAPIALGEWVHEHNVGMHDFERDYAIRPRCKTTDFVPVRTRYFRRFQARKRQGWERATTSAF